MERVIKLHPLYELVCLSLAYVHTRIHAVVYAVHSHYSFHIVYVSLVSIVLRELVSLFSTSAAH